MLKINHVAALTVFGWYLMVPQVESCNGSFSGHQCHWPTLAQWRTVHEFDSLPKCEQSKDAWIEKGQLYLTDMEASSRSRTTRMTIDEMLARSEIQATCVASDDQRLKER